MAVNARIEGGEKTGVEGVAPVPPVVDNTAAAQPQPVQQPQPQPQQQYAQPQAQYDPNAQMAQVRSKVPDINMLLKNSVSATAFSEEGTNYVKKLLERLNARKNILPADLQVINLSYPPESLAFVCLGKAIILIFSETNSQHVDRPVFELSEEAIRTLQRTCGGKVEVRNTIVVAPQDYARADQMSVEIVGELQGVLDRSIIDASLESFRNSDLTIVTDRNWCDNYLATHDPHGVKDRDSLIMAVCVSNRRNRNNMYDSQGNPIQTNEDLQTLAVISGYVDFMITNQLNITRTGYLYMPVVHISRIVSSVQNEKFILLYISVAIERWITNGGWRAQFDDIGNFSPNIGNLTTDPATAAPKAVTNATERDQFINENCTAPLPVIDVVNGRARIPSLERYAMPEIWSQAILASCNSFLQGRGAVPNVQPTSVIYTDYTGNFQSANTSSYQDSRWIDYLNVMIHSKDPNRCAKLLVKQPDPLSEFRVIKEYGPEVNPLYLRQVVCIVPEVSSCLASAIRNAVNIVNNGTRANSINIDSYIKLANAFAYAPQMPYSPQNNIMMNVYGMPGAGGNIVPPTNGGTMFS